MMIGNDDDTDTENVEEKNNNGDEENVKTNQRVHPQPARSQPSFC